MAEASPEAGWYVDPRNDTREPRSRYWNGTEWTDRTWSNRKGERDSALSSAEPPPNPGECLLQESPDVDQPSEVSPTRRGWYPDGERSGWSRRFNGALWTTRRERSHPLPTVAWMIFTAGLLGISLFGWFSTSYGGMWSSESIENHRAYVDHMSSQQTRIAIVTGILLGLAALWVTVLNRPTMLAFIAVALGEEWIFVNMHRNLVNDLAHSHGVTTELRGTLNGWAGVSTWLGGITAIVSVVAVMQWLYLARDDWASHHRVPHAS